MAAANSPSLIDSINLQVKTLQYYEDDLVEELELKKPKELSRKLFQKCIISDAMMDTFASLDHCRVDPQLQVRYLLRLVCAKLQQDETVWEKFLSLLSSISMKEVSERLWKNAASLVSDKTIQSRRGNTDYSFSVEDVPALLEVLVPVSHKWELLGTALALPPSDIENFRRHDNKISLKLVILCWISGGTKAHPRSNFYTLQQALRSATVGEGQLALNLEGRYRDLKANECHPFSRKQGSSNKLLTILNQSCDTEVADGKSTLLLVQGTPKEPISYQWKKNGQPLTSNSIYNGVCDDILVVNTASQGIEGEYTCCVSNQEKTVESNKIILTVLYPVAKKRLLNQYSIYRDVPPDSWPPVGTKTFINLVLIESNVTKTNSSNCSISGDADKVIVTKRKTEYKLVFGKYKSKGFILLEGRPGCGKTTLVHKIIRDWTKGNILFKAKLVLLIPLRILNKPGEETLNGILRLFYVNEDELKNVATEIEQSDGEGVCFILDGYDEYQPDHQNQSLIQRLLDKTYLPQSMIIVSSRPVALESLNNDILTDRIEVFGFNKDQIMEYIDSFPFGSDSHIPVPAPTDPAKLKEYLHSHTNVFNMCYLPVHAAMICFLYKHEEGKIPCTQTKIYTEFTRCLILRHLRRLNKDAQLYSLKDLKGKTQKYFDFLCLLAFKMTSTFKQVTSLEEINIQLPQNPCLDSEWSLGLLTVNHRIQLSGIDKIYAFLHLTFQEFLTAYYIASLDKQEEMETVSKYAHQPKRLRTIRSHMSSTVWTFYCGLVDFQREDGLNKLYKILDGYERHLWLDFAFESQQQHVCDEVVKSLRGRFHVYSNPTSDWSALSYVTSTTTQAVTEIELPPGCAVTSLLQQICEQNLHQLQVLSIGEHLSCDSSIKALGLLLQSCRSLRKSWMKFSDISEDSAKCITNGLKDLNFLQELTISYIAGAPGVMALLRGLGHLTNTELTLGFRTLDNNGVLMLASGLVALRNHNLYDLELSGSSVSLDTASPLCQALQCLSRLHHLDLSKNNIGPKGTVHLAVALKCLTHLEYLNLSNNNIGADGAAAFATELPYLTSLWFLQLSHNNIGPAGAVSLANGFNHLTKLNLLFLSNNNIDLVSAIVVVKSLNRCLNLRTVDMNADSQKNHYGRIYLHGLVSHEDTTTITDLISAVQHETQDRKLDLGFRVIPVPSQQTEEICENESGN